MVAGIDWHLPISTLKIECWHQRVNPGPHLVKEVGKHLSWSSYLALYSRHTNFTSLLSHKQCRGQPRATAFLYDTLSKHFFDLLLHLFYTMCWYAPWPYSGGGFWGCVVEVTVLLDQASEGVSLALGEMIYHIEVQYILLLLQHLHLQ